MHLSVLFELHKLVYSHAWERWWSEGIFNITVENIVSNIDYSKSSAISRFPKKQRRKPMWTIVRSKIIIHRPEDRV